MLLSLLAKRLGPSFEYTWIPTIQGCFVPCLVEIGPVVLEKKIFKYFQYNFTISLLSHVALHLNKLESPPSKDALCHVWLKLAQWFWRRSWTCEKFTDDRQTTDNRQSEKLTWVFISGELKITFIHWNDLTYKKKKKSECATPPM